MKVSGFVCPLGDFTIDLTVSGRVTGHKGHFCISPMLDEPAAQALLEAIKPQIRAAVGEWVLKEAR